MNLKEKFEELQTKVNTYLSLGYSKLDIHMGGLTPKAMHVIGGAPKTGKTKLVSSKFIIEPYLDNLAKGSPFNLKCAFYSFEMDKESVQFEFASYFFYRDHGIEKFNYRLSTGETIMLYISSRYLMSNLIALNGLGKVEKIVVSEEHKKILFDIIDKRIVPMFKDYIWFQEKRTNPTGIYKDIKTHMMNMGTVKYEDYYIKTKLRNPATGELEEKTVKRSKISEYIPDDPTLLQIVVIDHVRKLKPEKGYSSMKERIDLLSDYFVQLRNTYSITPVCIVHTNRSSSSIERQKHQGDKLFPNDSDLKDTGNLAEDANYVWTCFNPTDEQYALTTHFGLKLRTEDKKYEFLRTLHLVQARGAECPAHFSYNFNGAQGVFKTYT